MQAALPTQATSAENTWGESRDLALGRTQRGSAEPGLSTSRLWEAALRLRGAC